MGVVNLHAVHSCLTADAGPVGKLFYQLIQLRRCKIGRSLRRTAIDPLRGLQPAVAELNQQPASGTVNLIRGLGQL